MGHETRYLEYDENTSKRTIENEANNIAVEDGDYHTGLNATIRWLDAICEDRERAYEYIESHDKGWYDQLAVKYREYEPIKPSVAFCNLQTRLANERAKKAEYEKAHSVLAFKAEYVGCPNCGSKLKRDLLRTNSCPLCRTEMRSKTTMETLARYESNIRDLEKQIKAEERKLQEKNLKKSKIKWLVKIEYHT